MSRKSNPSRRPVIAEGLFSYQIGGSERVGIDLALEFREVALRTPELRSLFASLRRAPVPLDV